MVSSAAGFTGVDSAYTYRRKGSVGGLGVLLAAQHEKFCVAFWLDELKVLGLAVQL